MRHQFFKFRICWLVMGCFWGALSAGSSPDRYCGKGKMKVSSGGLTATIPIPPVSTMSGNTVTYACASVMPAPSITPSTVSGNVHFKCVGNTWQLDFADCVVTPYCGPASIAATSGTTMTGTFVVSAAHTNSGNVVTQSCSSLMTGNAPSLITGNMSYKCVANAFALDIDGCIEKTICGPGTVLVAAVGQTANFSVTTPTSYDGDTETKTCTSAFTAPALPATLSGNVILKCVGHNWTHLSNTCVIIP